jgi:hypothetical protein
LVNPEVEVYFPIAFDVAVVSVGTRSDLRFVQLREDRDIRYINEGIFVGSTMIAARSRDLVASLARCK